MKSRSWLFGLALALVVGAVSGLPFREQTGDEKSGEKEQDQGLARALNPAGGDLNVSPEEEAILALTSNDPAYLRRAFDRSFRSGGRASEVLGSLIAKRWAELDPAGMYDDLMSKGGLSRKRPGAVYKYGYADTLFAEWVKSDTEAAIAAAMELSRHVRYRDPAGLSRVGSYLIDNDPERAQSLFDENPKALMNATRYGIQTTEDKAGFMDFWSGLRPSRYQIQTMGNHVARWLTDDGGSDAGASWNWLVTQPEEIRGNVFEYLLTSERAKVPAPMFTALQEYVSAHPELGAHFSKTYAETLVEESGFEGALKWASESLRGVARHEALGALFAQARSAELEQLVGAYDSLPMGNLRDSAVSVIVKRMTTDGDPLGAMQWIEGQELRAHQRSSAVAAWVDQFARSSPKGAADFINENAESPESRQLLQATIQRMAFNQEGGPISLEFGLDWLNRLENDAAATAAAGKIFSGYGARRDIEEARKQAELITRPEVRTAAIEGVVVLEAREAEAARKRASEQSKPGH